MASETTYPIRKAVTADLPALVAFGAQAGEETYLKTGFLPAAYVTGPQRTYWQADYLQSVIENENAILLVVYDDQTLIGMTEVEVLGDEEAVMWKLYIHHSYHGRGIGSQLLNEITERLPPTVRQLKTEYYDSNLPAARFYTAKGFTFLERKTETFEEHIIPYTFVSKSIQQ